MVATAKWLGRIGNRGMSLNALLSSAVRCLCMLVVMTGMSAGAAAQVLEPAVDKASANIINQVSYLRDGSGVLSFKEVIRPAAQRSLKTLKSTQLRTAFDDPAQHWFKFEISAPDNQPYKAVLFFTDLDVSDFKAFFQVFGANADVVQYSKGSAGGDAFVKRGGIGLPITLEAGARRTVYAVVKGKSLQGTIELWQPAALETYLETQASRGLGALIAAAVALLFALITAIVKRSSAWLMLGAGIGLFTTGFALSRGMQPFPAMSVSTDTALAIRSVFAMLVLGFISTLSGQSQRLPAMSWFSMALGAALLVCSGLIFFAPPQANLILYILISFASALCLGFAVSFFSLRKSANWAQRGQQAVLTAPLILLALPLPLSLYTVGFLPLILCAAFGGAIALFELIGRDKVVTKTEGATGELDGLFDAPETIKEGARPRSFAEKVDDLPPKGKEASTPTLVAPRGNQEVGVDPVKIGRSGMAFGGPTTFDEMTGAFSAPTIKAIADKLIYQLRRYERDGSVIMIKLPSYTRLREINGTATSDRAIKLLAVTSMRELREGDTVGRLHDDVFIALLPETPVSGAHSAIQRICARLAERAVPTRDGMVRLEPLVSAMTINPKEDDFEAIVKELESALGLPRWNNGVQAAE